MGRCGCEMTVKAALNQLLMRLADGIQRELRRQDFCLDENLRRAFEQTHTLDAMERALRMLLEDVLSQVQAMRRNSGCQLLIQANQYLKQYSDAGPETAGIAFKRQPQLSFTSLSQGDGYHVSRNVE